ncbi:hypothetical protein ACFLR8_03850 [Bacteroidota bacterium]
MKKSIFIALFFLPVLFAKPTAAQEVYAISSWENLFQWADVENTGYAVNEKLRYTLAFNVGQYWHVDFNNMIGFYSGLGVRNVGFIYDTDLPTKTIRRSYNLGVPLAIKLGVFDKKIYIMGGGEYELLFHYKARRWDSNKRRGPMTVEDEWFSDKTERFIPSVFAGIQFPGGFNIKLKYYLGDFLDLDYTGDDLREPNVSFSEYTKINMYYISICWQFRTDQMKKYIPIDDKVAHIF